MKNDREVALFAHVGALRTWLSHIERHTSDPRTRKEARFALTLPLELEPEDWGPSIYGWAPGTRIAAHTFQRRHIGRAAAGAAAPFRRR
jgi:hypothetical protein